MFKEGDLVIAIDDMTGIKKGHVDEVWHVKSGFLYFESGLGGYPEQSFILAPELAARPPTFGPVTTSENPKCPHLHKSVYESLMGPHANFLYCCDCGERSE